ncbi:MAG: Membrane transport protein [Alphaproteobacteria bacterium ADurb.BinA280]|jgi:predicted permease|nr:AEC family transporter [Xanthomonadales bacterium]OPZ11145.1 MAG: Membrane transport protein [Alphaproteobacteria bacterium ADurb.BinA280]
MAADAFALVFLMLALGMLCQRIRLFADNAGETLNRVVLYVLLPAAVLRFASKLTLDISLLGLVAVPWLILLASIAAIELLSRLWSFSPQAKAVLLLCVPLSNSSFLGYPLVQAMLGDDALPYAVVYDQFGSFVMLSTWGVWVLARYAGDSPPSVREVAKRMVRFPPLIALLVALTVMPASPPHVVDAVLQRLSDAILPVVSLAVGLQLRLRLSRLHWAPLASGVVLKLLVMPVIAWVTTWGVGLQGEMAQVAVLETAMPPMITAGALAISHRLAPELAAALVGWGMVLSLGSLPLWHAWLGA